MALTLKFKIEESPDAQSFVFRDVTGAFNSGTNPGGWGGSNIAVTDVTEAFLNIRYQDGTSYKYTLPTASGFLSIWEAGIEITRAELVIPSLLIPDGVYDFDVDIKTISETITSPSVIMGFIAVITGRVMKESLSYHPHMERSYKEWVMENQRLLSNLKYSADTGNLQHFRDNLEQLKRIK